MLDLCLTKLSIAQKQASSNKPFVGHIKHTFQLSNQSGCMRNQKSIITNKVRTFAWGCHNNSLIEVDGTDQKLIYKIIRGLGSFFVITSMVNPVWLSQYLRVFKYLAAHKYIVMTTSLWQNCRKIGPLRTLFPKIYTNS